jgi:hypothetical protein
MLRKNGNLNKIKKINTEIEAKKNVKMLNFVKKFKIVYPKLHKTK